MIIHSDAGVGKVEKNGKKTVEAAIAFYTSEGTLYHQKIENFNTTYAKSTSNTAELLASLKAFEVHQDKLESITFYTDCDILPLAKNYYLTHLNDRYVDPLYVIKNIAIENHLEDKIDLLIEAIKKVNIVKVKGHTKGMENSYIDDVCYKVLNNQSPLNFDEFVELTKFTIFTDAEYDANGNLMLKNSTDNAINQEDKKVAENYLNKLTININYYCDNTLISSTTNSIDNPKSIREKRIYHKYIQAESKETKEKNAVPNLSN